MQNSWRPRRYILLLQLAHGVFQFTGLKLSNLKLTIGLRFGENYRFSLHPLGYLANEQNQLKNVCDSR